MLYDKHFQRYGYFPLIDGELWQEQSFDLTRLLAYFNKNKTINHSLVPHIGENDVDDSEAIIMVMLCLHRFLFVNKRQK